MTHNLKSIVVADPLSESALAQLARQDGVVIHQTFLEDGPDFESCLLDAEAIIVRSETRITRQVIEKAPKLKVIGRAGVGIDNIDLDAATERGLMELNTPGGNSVAAIELTFAMLLLTARPVAEAAASMRAGEWARKRLGGSELNGKTLAVFGCGRIGGGVVERAHAFGMKVLVYDPFLTVSRAAALGVESREFSEALAAADFITLHLPLTEDTRHIINREAFRAMRPGVRLVNCSRGEVLAEVGLIEAIEAGIVARAALDVFEREPLPADSPLRFRPEIILTPHLGASTREAQDQVGREIGDSVILALAGQPVANAVNCPPMDERTRNEVAPFAELGERLGRLAAGMASGRIGTIRIGYFGLLADLDTNLVTRAVQKGFLRHSSGRDVNWINAPSKLKALGIRCEVLTALTLDTEPDEAAVKELAATDGVCRVTLLDLR